MFGEVESENPIFYIIILIIFSYTNLRITDFPVPG